MHHSRIEHVWILVALVAALAWVPHGSLLAQGDPSTAKDPICGMTVKTAGAKFTSTYEGKTYYFCSETCKKTFDKEPAKHVKK